MDYVKENHQVFTEEKEHYNETFDAILKKYNEYINDLPKYRMYFSRIFDLGK